MTSATAAAAASTLVLLLVAANASAGHGKLPSPYKTCRQIDPDFNGCLLAAMQSAAPLLKKGIPSLGVPSIDPMPFASIKIQHENKERPIAADLEFDNLLIYGMSSGSVDSVEMVPGSFRMKAHLSNDNPEYMIGTYKVDGKVLVLPIMGEGACNITIVGFNTDMEMWGDSLERDGEVYWDIKNFTMKMDIAKAYIHLDNLFNGDKVLGENMNKFLNVNADLLVEELRPAIEMGLAGTFLDVARRMFNKVPYNSVFPPS